jgi:hypothetical protein
MKMSVQERMRTRRQNPGNWEVLSLAAKKFESFALGRRLGRSRPEKRQNWTSEGEETLPSAAESLESLKRAERLGRFLQIDQFDQ